ncbi:hypothetical protein BMF89_20445 [Arthrobacter sp. SRS-W-1-2016]|uniref:hypothetical protein n=1 Tax=Arthrobacter sp. SRS-W-1-2016 TaxID=1930254 RepID=UPI000990E966|nr:hypothetical protein [Arthrobacter sp. SRS-W-1-2016]OOP59409.1 hypothetical protein BMF89_20445 [Arthrobacter sp. SRS-W-1-2016]
MPKNIIRSSTVALAIVAMAAMTAGCGQSPESSSAVTPAAAASSPSATPTVLPVPDGCPPGDQLGQAWAGKTDLLTSIDAKLVDSELKTPLPKNGCAYLYGPPGTASNSTDKFQHVLVWYFNTNRPSRTSTSDITAWAKAAGGTPLTGTDPVSNKPTTDTTGHDFDLPDTFSSWSKSTVVQVVGEGTSFGFDQSVIPAYTQGSQSKIYFSVNADKAQAMLKASGAASTAGASASDPTKALSQGLTASFSTSLGVADDQGYTAQLKVQGKLEPFTKDVTEAPPGQLNAVSSSTVSGSITNTTSGRQTKATGASVVAVYPLESPACTNYNGISVKGDSWQKSSFCQIDLGFVESTILSPDATQTLKGSTVPQKLGTFPESGPAISQLNSPASIYLSFGSKGHVVVGVDWHGDKGCMASQGTASDSWYVAMDGWPDVICK